MSAPKRQKLDFSSMLAGSRDLASAVKSLDCKLGEVKSTLMKYQTDYESYRRLMEMSSADNAELQLVCRLGLEGLDCLRLALQKVPSQYGEKRYDIITLIVNKVLSSINKPLITGHESEVLSKICTRKVPSYFTRKNYEKELWDLTGECGKFRYSDLLCPPTSVCLNPSCDQHPLRSYTAPTKITLYDVTGPRPASNISLRCSKCKANYHYSMFGNKTSRGERYSDEEREYIEASDVVFVSREVHQLFVSLTLVLPKFILTLMI